MKIADVILNRINRDYLLPSIQREFVWLKNAREEKIEKLFDSIMQEYPIGTILTWVYAVTATFPLSKSCIKPCLSR